MATHSTAYGAVTPELLELVPQVHRDKFHHHVEKRNASFSSSRQLLKSLPDDYDYDVETIDKFLELQTEVAVNDVHAMKAILQGLQDLEDNKNQKQDLDRIRKERDRLLESIRPLSMTIGLLKRSRRGIVDDIAEELPPLKPSGKRQPADDQSETMLEATYTRNMRQHILGAHRHQRSSLSKNQNAKTQEEFKEAAREYYNGHLTFPDEMSSRDDSETWCHVTGQWHESRDMRVVHLVPRGLSPESAEYLFGSDQVSSRQSPKNALLLHHVVEKAWNKGDIAIVPVATGQVEAIRWKFVLLNADIRDKRVYTWPRSARTLAEFRHVYFKDLVDRELSFRNDNRPAGRFLYLRFIITLIHARKNRDHNVLQRLGITSEAPCFWPAPGAYLDRSTLVPIVRQISGLTLPASLLNSTTFEGGRSEDEVEAITAMIDFNNVISNGQLILP